MNKIILASSNAGKLREFNDLLNNVGLEVKAQGEFDVPDAIEDGLTFVENAIKKARNACAHTGLPAIADDSGLEVDSLQGAPGIYSARYSSDGDQGASDASNNAKLLSELANVDDHARTARYQCVLVFMRHANDPSPIICQQAWEGTILKAPRGTGGFGYDPLFWLPELKQSAAELDKEYKNRISHRGKAMALLLEQMQTELNMV